MALCLLAPASIQAKNKALEKALKKELKVKLKDYQKQKWEIMGSHSMEVALASHYDKLAQLGEDGHEVEGISTMTKSKNTGKQMAINNATITYAQEAGSTLQGRIVSEMHASGIDTAGELEEFYGAYERLVEREIKNEMQPSYTICRTNPDGTYEVRTYYIIAESAAAKARQRALDEALKSSEAAQKLGEKISGFVQQGFDK